MVINLPLLKHQRIIDDNEIKLFQSEDNIEYRVRNLKDENCYCGIINMPNALKEVDIDTRMTYFVGCEIIIKDTFPLFLDPCHKWNLIEQEVCLLRTEDDDLIFQVFDKVTGQCSQTSFETTYLHNGITHKSYHKKLFLKSLPKMKIGNLIIFKFQNY